MISSKPSQYIKGWVEFYKLKFKVTPDVLIPRPETELLVDEIIRYVIARNKVTKQSFTVLDIGTGAGNIAISIAKNLSLHPRSGKLNIVATDISFKALKVAKQNARLHGVEKHISFIKSDLLSSLNSQYDVRSHTLLLQPDIIVTNLPYIPSARIPYLDSSIKDFEPLVALDGGRDGFDLYRKLFQQIVAAPQECKPKLIVCEIDYTHGELAVNEALKYFPDAARPSGGGEVEVKTDLAHKQRILKIRFS